MIFKILTVKSIITVNFFYFYCKITEINIFLIILLIQKFYIPLTFNIHVVLFY